jgi:hypothetical protein
MKKYPGIPDKLIKNGHTKDGKQRLINVTKGYTQYEDAIKITEYDKNKAIYSYLTGSSYRAIGRANNRSHTTISRWCEDFYDKIDGLDLVDKTEPIINLEIDEMWHFIKKKLQNVGFGLLLTEKNIKLLILKLVLEVKKPLKSYTKGLDQ